MEMKRFVSNVLLFLCILLLLMVVCAFLPPTPRVATSNIFSKIKKDQLLEKVESPRIIFIGGSGLCFGLNSQMVKDSLGMNPINTAVTAGLGLIYMLDVTERYVRRGDVVVVAPEYAYFFGSFAYGNESLLRTVMDVSRSDLRLLRIQHWVNLVRYIPRYSFSKLKLSEYYLIKGADVYGVDSFNKYGDVDYHWDLPQREFEPFKPDSKPFKYSVIEKLSDFEKRIKAKGAVLFITFPGYQDISYENRKERIVKVEEALKKKGFTLLGTPERYKMPGSFMFNTPYHLTKQGLDYRTQLLIDDLKSALRDFQ
jgi:hypothetical protein